MLEPVRRTLAFLREKQILHKLGVALSLMVIGFALHILYQMLRDIDLDDVLKALRGTEVKTVALAGLCVAAGYFTLTFYDFFALRAIGRWKDAAARRFCLSQRRIASSAVPLRVEKRGRID